MHLYTSTLDIRITPSPYIDTRGIRGSKQVLVRDYASAVMMPVTALHALDEHLYALRHCSVDVGGAPAMEIIACK
jgi:hypothetical protein